MNSLSTYFQVYALGGFLVLKWIWARWQERRDQKEEGNEDENEDEKEDEKESSDDEKSSVDE